MVRSDQRTFSSRALRTLAAFGLTVADVGLDGHTRARTLDRLSRLSDRVATELRPARTLLITGASGAGKSTLLSLLAAAIEARGRHPVWSIRTTDLERRRARAIDLVSCACRPSPRGRSGSPEHEHERGLRLLSRAGLSDARLAVMRACDLSDGERARLALALGMARCTDAPGPVLMVDEFGTGLDDTTARSVAHGLARWCAATGASAAVVTHREALIGPLRAAAIVRM